MTQTALEAVFSFPDECSPPDLKKGPAMTPSPSLLEATVRSGSPFALIARDADTVELLTGDVVDVELLADIPLMDASGTPREVLALVPFRQVVERGFDCHDDQAPLGYPEVHYLTSPLRKAAVAAGDPDGTNVWAGTGFRKIRSGSVADIMAGLG